MYVYMSQMQQSDIDKKMPIITKICGGNYEKESMVGTFNNVRLLKGRNNPKIQFR